MTFGEKLFKLRKEKGLSQEALSEQVGTTRQAISKWENNQGFPETEKLMILSNIFEVSVDYLLKESTSSIETTEKGFYVSKEMAVGFFSNEKKVIKYIGIGFFFLLFSGIPYAMFLEQASWRILGMSICIVLGITSFAIGMFQEDDKYKVLKQEPLLFDYDFLKELSTKYNLMKKKCQFIALLCAILLVISAVPIFLVAKDWISWYEYHSLSFLGLSIGLFGLIQSLGKIETYELLVKNEQYCNRLWFKLTHKFKDKLNSILS